MATAKQLDDITECSICTEVYTDPRVLPCVHTYCLKCIEAWSKDKQSRDKLACPLCTKEFTLPSNGVRGLPRNFFVNDLLQLKELTIVKSKMSPCDACSGDELSENKLASVYCVECQQKLCHACSKCHKKIKTTASHEMIKLGEEVDIEALSDKLPSSKCSKHTGDQLRIYCLECEVAICMMCYIESHSAHKCSDVGKVADEFRTEMTSDVSSVEFGIGRCREMLESLEKEKSDFHQQITKAGKHISEKAKLLKRMIGDHKEKLMNEMSSMEQKRMKEIESLREEIERQMISMESYKKYVDEVRQKGTACDIARAARDMHTRADELLTFDVIERSLADLGYTDVTFTPSNFDIDDVSKTLGQLRMNTIKTREFVAFLPRDALQCKARYCDRMSSVRLSVRL